MRIRIEGTDLPGSACGPSSDRPGGYANIHVAVQRRGKPGELLGLAPGDSPAVAWTLDATLTATADLRGPYIQGPPGARFIYLNWGTIDTDGTADGAGTAEPASGGADRNAFVLFRRAKVWLDCVPLDVLRAADAHGTLVGRLGLTDAKGHPLCASVRPPLIEWSASG